MSLQQEWPCSSAVYCGSAPPLCRITYKQRKLTNLDSEPHELFQNWDLHFQKFPPNHSCIQLIFIELIHVPGFMLNTGDGMASKTLWTKDNQIFSSGCSSIETNCKDIFKQTFKEHLVPG